jgi:hypothetical protein
MIKTVSDVWYPVDEKPSQDQIYGHNKKNEKKDRQEEGQLWMSNKPPWLVGIFYVRILNGTS